ncbi:hypothetical protein JCM9534A_17880 [Catenuloplanes indicus JCM 9534]
MRRYGALLVAACLGSVLAGCAGDETEPSVSPSRSVASLPAREPVATCVRGDWRTTTVAWHGNGPVSGGSISGGRDVRLSVADDGAVVADFTGMQPVVFSVPVAGAPVNGQFRYTGRATGIMTTGPTPTPPAGTPPTPTPLPAPASTGPAPASSVAADPSGPVSGAWLVDGPVDWSGVRLTVDLTAPAETRLFDAVPLSEYTGSGATRTADVVDVKPLLDDGRYLCDGRTLIMFFEGAKNVGWVLEPAG